MYLLQADIFHFYCNELSSSQNFFLYILLALGSLTSLFFTCQVSISCEDAGDCDF